MENRLNEAARTGNTKSLHRLLEEDELLLDRITVESVTETPLHVSARLRHLDFVTEIMKLKPQLARELDSNGFSPLHLVSERGDLEITKAIVRGNPDLCNVTDHEGRIPLHAAAIQGQTEVFKELYSAKPETIRSLTDHGESVLHLCVKNDRFEVMKTIIEWVNDNEFVNLRDKDGNNVLHIAARKKDVQAVEYLLRNTGINVTSKNREGFTAIEILSQDVTRTENRNMEASISKEMTKSTWSTQPKSWVMIVAALIAATSFQFVLRPPGGTAQTTPSLNPGKSIGGDNSHFNGVQIGSLFAFFPSLSVILVSASWVKLHRKVLFSITTANLILAMIGLGFSYLYSLRVTTPVAHLHTFFKVFFVILYVITGITGLGVIAFFFLRWKLRASRR